ISSYGDIDENTEFGAMGIAIAIVNNQTGWKVKRSYKGTGFDFWVGDADDELFQNKWRLEISGDYTGTDNELKSRLRKKLKQTKQSDQIGIPAVAVIIEFSSPKSLTGMR